MGVLVLLQNEAHVPKEISEFPLEVCFINLPNMGWLWFVFLGTITGVAWAQVATSLCLNGQCHFPFAFVVLVVVCCKLFQICLFIVLKFPMLAFFHPMFELFTFLKKVLIIN